MVLDRLSDLRSFAVIARTRSFRAAAVELGVSPSALSHSLRALETSLGLRLLHRTTRSVAPTAAGQQLLERLAPALMEIEEALEGVNAFRDTPTGALRINAPIAATELVLAPMMASFLRAHPGMSVELVADDALTDIVAQGFDAGVRFGESLQQDMVAVPLGPPQRFVVVASPAYLAEHPAPKKPMDLQHHACIGLQFPSGARYRWEFSKRQQQLSVEVRGPLWVGNMHVALRAALDGLGLAYVYQQYAQEALADARLVAVLEDWCPRVSGFFLYYPSRKLMSAGLKAFIAATHALRDVPP